MQEALTTLERVEALQRDRIQRGLCGCPCGGARVGLSGQSLYLNERHKQRAYRERVKAAAESVGVQASLTLAAARASTSPQGRNGDAHTARKRREKRSPDLRVSYRKAVAAIDQLATRYDDLSPVRSGLAEAREAIEGLLTEKQRASLARDDG